MGESKCRGSRGVQHGCWSSGQPQHVSAEGTSAQVSSCPAKETCCATNTQAYSLRNVSSPPPLLPHHHYHYLTRMCMGDSHSLFKNLAKLTKVVVINMKVQVCPSTSSTSTTSITSTTLTTSCSFLPIVVTLSLHHISSPTNPSTFQLYHHSGNEKISPAFRKYSSKLPFSVSSQISQFMFGL